MSTGPPIILLLEANAALAHLFFRALTSSGCVVHSATTIEAARQQLTDPLPQLALIDLEPPRFEGLQLVEHLQHTAPTVHVLTMTAAFPPPEVPGVPLLLKPFSILELSSIIAAHFATEVPDALDAS